MKKIAIIVAVAIAFIGTSANALVHVKGYTKINGTYVAPHVRTNPDGIKSNNFSYWIWYTIAVLN